MSRPGRFRWALLASAALLAAGPAAGQSRPTAPSVAAEEAEVAKTMREVRRKLRLGPIVLSNDRLVEGETKMSKRPFANGLELADVEHCQGVLQDTAQPSSVQPRVVRIQKSIGQLKASSS